MDTGTEKLYIIEQIIKLKDEELIHAIKSLLDFGLKYQPEAASSEDFWDGLSSKQKERVESAIQALDAGQGIPHEEVMASFRKRLQQ
jgi:phosphosulfolactate synthase (CoM biosynthesis protein A)